MVSQPSWKDQNQELAGIAEKVLKTIRREVEEKGLKLSITEGGKEEKSKVIASCSFLEEKFQECPRKKKRESVSGNPRFRGPSRENKKKASSGVVCGSKQIPLHEVRKLSITEGGARRLRRPALWKRSIRNAARENEEIFEPAWNENEDEAVGSRREGEKEEV